MAIKTFCFRLLFISLALISINLPVQALETKNVRLYARTQTGMTVGHCRNLWGWQNPSTDSIYALVPNHLSMAKEQGDSSQCGMLVYNTTNPYSPYLAAKIQPGLTDRRFDDVSVFGNYMFCSQDI